MKSKNKVENPGIRLLAAPGGTFSGKKGASAMLESVIFNLRHLLDNKLTIDVIRV
jgi:hypothetical protein